MALMQIPISKGTGIFIEIDTDELMDEAFPVDSFKEIIYQGLKQVLNRGQSKLASTKGMEGKELEGANAALEAKANETLTQMRAGEIRVTGGKAKTKGIARAVKVEAMRLAKLAVKDSAKRAGMKVSLLKAKDITACAEELLSGEQGEVFVAQAKETIEAREKAELNLGIDLGKIELDPKLVAQAEQKKAQGKAGTKSKKAANVVQQRAKPVSEQHTSH